MTDVNKGSVPGLPLRSWNEFSRDMNPYMEQFDETLREHMLIALYHRAEFQSWLEGLRVKEAQRAPLLRKERVRGERVRRHIQNAVDSLRRAETLGDQESLETKYVHEARELLERTVEDLLFLEDVRIALIHPDQRNKTEKARKMPSVSLEHWNLFPGFGIAKIDQMFVGWMEKYLSTLLTRKGSRLSSAAINRLITATFRAAFGGAYDEERVRTTRRRLARKRTESGQK